MFCNIFTDFADDLFARRIIIRKFGTTDRFSLLPMRNTSQHTEIDSSTIKAIAAHGGLNLYDNTSRLHDPILCSFTTPDPQAFKYPGINPYSHCAANPLNFIAPTGEDIYVMDVYGNIINTIVDKDLVQFQIVNTGDGFNYIATVINAPADIVKKEEKKTAKGKPYDLYTITDTEVAVKLFEFFARHTKVEWGYLKPKGEKNNNYLTTSHQKDKESGLGHFAEIVVYSDNIVEINHCHPNNISTPSGRTGTPSEGKGDIEVARIINREIDKMNKWKKAPKTRTTEHPKYRIFTPKTGDYYEYDTNTQ